MFNPNAYAGFWATNPDIRLTVNVYGNIGIKWENKFKQALLNAVNKKECFGSKPSSANNKDRPHAVAAIDLKNSQLDLRCLSSEPG